MKLAIICSQFPETHETFVLREIESLRQAGFPLIVYSLKKCKDKIVHPEAALLMQKTVYLAWDNIKIWGRALKIGFTKPSLLFHGIKDIFRLHGQHPLELIKGFIILFQSLVLADEIQLNEIRHLHSHWATFPTTACLLASRFTGIPFSFTAHAWDIFVKNPSLKEKIRRAATVITCTSYNERFLKKLDPPSRHKIHLNYHGVDLCRFLPRRSISSELASSESFRQIPAPVTFLSIGRFVEQKGFEDLITAVELLHKKRSDFRVILVGSDGPLKKQILEKIRKTRLEKWIHIKPSMTRQEILKLYLQSSAFVLPCVVAKNRDRDGIPNVLLEAMAMGLPVVTTPVSGLPEVVADQKTGNMVRPHHPEELADCLERILENPTPALKMGCRGKDFVSSHFDSRLHMKSLVNVMAKIVPEELGRGVSLPPCWEACRAERHTMGKEPAPHAIQKCS